MTVELLPLDVPEVFVKLDKTDKTEGLARLARLSAVRWTGYCFVVKGRRRSTSASFFWLPRRVTGNTGSFMLSLCSRRRLSCSFSFPSNMLPSLGKKPDISFPGEVSSGADDLLVVAAEEMLLLYEGQRLPPPAVRLRRGSSLSTSSHVGDAARGVSLLLRWDLDGRLHGEAGVNADFLSLDL